MLLTDLSRLDFRQLFICHKPLFYEAYRDWSDGQKAFVVQFLQEEYAMDKVGAREALFGAEPDMTDTPKTSRRRPRPNGKRKNPWDGKNPWDDRDDDDDDDRDDDDWRHRSEQRRAYDKRQKDKSKKKKRK
jgi:hypothetical protein